MNEKHYHFALLTSLRARFLTVLIITRLLTKGIIKINLSTNITYKNYNKQKYNI